MSDANLGLLCNVCGKIFKSRDALDFHIMYTKLPGHDVLQQVIVCLFSRRTGRANLECNPYEVIHITYIVSKIRIDLLCF